MARATDRSRSSRLEFRVDDATKTRVETAARYEARSVTDFCLAALTEAAERAIAKHETLVLSDADRRSFFDALIAPPSPNARLRRAAERAKKLVRA